eukprot:TRINITY_DN1063_c2_g1_i1.p1 TRINITY_DN1063_c2_g1~~TRINITY_DN1063_c2_g1_i1.p1  ORF type:complete len:229 (+),score=-22.17 TRINITY_DN1063_c2_g1_i1:707-1393(+)
MSSIYTQERKTNTLIQARFLIEIISKSVPIFQNCHRNFILQLTRFFHNVFQSYIRNTSLFVILVIRNAKTLQNVTRFKIFLAFLNNFRNVSKRLKLFQQKFVPLYIKKKRYLLPVYYILKHFRINRKSLKFQTFRNRSETPPENMKRSQTYHGQIYLKIKLKKYNYKPLQKSLFSKQPYRVHHNKYLHPNHFFLVNNNDRQQNKQNVIVLPYRKEKTKINQQKPTTYV